MILNIPFDMNSTLPEQVSIMHIEKIKNYLEAVRTIILKNDNEIEAKVESGGVYHYVALKNNTQKCTCTWYSKHQGERGACKHILAVKKKVNAN